MAKRSKKSQVVEVTEFSVPVGQPGEASRPTFEEPVAPETGEDIEAEQLDEEPIKVQRTVVPTKYKQAYAARAIAQGRTTKAAKRANGDWLAQELEAECMTGKTFDFDRFIAILEANGVRHDRWPNRNNGWQGRIRMSGAIVLRGVVRKAGVLVTPEGTYIDAPEAFTAQG